MVQNMNVQRKAQAEIDRIVPDWRLPNADDFEKLPYTGAIVKETMRWHLVTPLSAHRCVPALIFILIMATRSGPPVAPS
jgi:cytochrome P450